MRTDTTKDAAQAFRQRLMGVSARATREELRAALEALAPTLEARDVRKPEAGLVMLRGRAGGDGMPFNLGEATVSRATVALETGEVGHGYMLGRDTVKARLAAILDAIAQQPNTSHRISDLFLKPVEARIRREAEREAREIAATRVSFFTVARGED